MEYQCMYWQNPWCCQELWQYQNRQDGSKNCKSNEQTYFSIFQKYVLGFHVTMQNFSLVKIEKSKRHLHHPFQDLFFGEVLPFSIAGFYFAVDVSTVAIYHDYIQILLFIHIAIFICHNIRMPYLLKQPNFIFCIFKILLFHVTGFYSFDDIMFALSLVTSKVYLTK